VLLATSLFGKLFKALLATSLCEAIETVVSYISVYEAI